MDQDVTGTNQETTEKLSDFELHPEEKVIDSCFVVRESRYGMFNSFTLSGRPVLTALTRDVCEYMTRWHLQGEQDNWEGYDVKVIGSSYVSGKL
jgi:hypothetical protein